ncbi:hypothetical protein POMI540_2460 [Schizosaccharomyces pombe]
MPNTLHSVSISTDFPSPNVESEAADVNEYSSTSKFETLGNQSSTNLGFSNSLQDKWDCWKRDLWSIWWSLSRKATRFYRWLSRSLKWRPVTYETVYPQTYETQMSEPREVTTIVKDLNNGDSFVLNVTEPVDPEFLRANIPPVHRKHLPPRLSLVASPGTIPTRGVVVLEDWINPLLSERCKLLLQSELCNQDSYDCPGYICVYRFEQKNNPSVVLGDSTLIQISRVSDLQRHLREYPKNCAFSRSVLEIFPDPGKTSKPCQVSFKVERLVHKELNEYLSWMQPFTCDSCGSLHENWLQIDSKQWDQIRGVILRWVEYSRVIYA